MSPLKSAVARALVAAAAPWRAVVPARGLRILMYHAIGTPIPEDSQGRYNLDPSAFERQMQILKASGRTLAALREALPTTGVAVTFDDGYRDNLERAYPVLKAHGIPFTVFVTARNLDAPDDIYLRREELRALAQDPLATIGAHGFTHKPLTHLDDVELAKELCESRAALEAVIGRSVYGMSYPHGAFDARVVAAAAAAGYRWAASSRFGINPTLEQTYALRRTDIWAHDSDSDFKAKLAGRWDWLGWRG